AERGVDPARLCVQFSASHPGLATCVIGSGNPDNVRRWVDWVDQPLDPQEIADVEEILLPVIDRNFVYGRWENNDHEPNHAPGRVARLDPSPARPA
ncbi:MAG: hypothetical protein AAF961_03915, partial [Planctomycetota bacterium]